MMRHCYPRIKLLQTGSLNDYDQSFENKMVEINNVGVWPLFIGRKHVYC
jgi:hypothetical protein